MANLGPDKKGLGLDVAAPDEPTYLSGTTQIRSRHWWLTGRSLMSSIAFCAFWSLYAVYRLVELITKSGSSGTDWLLLIFPSLFALGSVPSIVFFSRSAHRKIIGTGNGTSSEPDGQQLD